MSFFIGNQEKFQTNSSVHSINTRNKHHLHRLVTNLSCFQKSAPYSGIRIFNNLPRSITSLKNENTQFKVALKKFLYVHSFYSVDEFFACTNDIVGRVVQSVQQLTMGWTVLGSNPSGARFSAHPDQPWGPPSLLYNGYQDFPIGKVQPGHAADHSPPSSATVMEE